MGGEVRVGGDEPEPWWFGLLLGIAVGRHGLLGFARREGQLPLAAL